MKSQLLFTVTRHCHGKGHCQTCRDKEDGRQWRKSLQKAFKLPNDKVDFECPYGVPWGARPLAKKLTKVQEKFQRQFTEKQKIVYTEYSRIGRICEACEERYDCKFVKQCTCIRKKQIRRGTAICPKARWQVKLKAIPRIPKR